MRNILKIILITIGLLLAVPVVLIALYYGVAFAWLSPREVARQTVMDSPRLHIIRKTMEAGDWNTGTTRQDTQWQLRIDGRSGNGAAYGRLLTGGDTASAWHDHTLSDAWPLGPGNALLYSYDARDSNQRLDTHYALLHVVAPPEGPLQITRMLAPPPGDQAGMDGLSYTAGYAINPLPWGGWLHTLANNHVVLIEPASLKTFELPYGIVLDANASRALLALSDNIQDSQGQWTEQHRYAIVALADGQTIAEQPLPEGACWPFTPHTLILEEARWANPASAPGAPREDTLHFAYVQQKARARLDWTLDGPAPFVRMKPGPPKPCDEAQEPPAPQ